LVILQEIQPATVRAVCYQLFIRRLIDSMDRKNTNRVSRQLVWAREQGIVPWPYIVDETRSVERVYGWSEPAAYIETIRHAYRRDRWAQQPCRVEIWSEKGTIRGTLGPLKDEYGVALRVMHGYSSATTVHDVVEECQADPRPLHVLYVGDYDPSGLHMSLEDLPARLQRYGGTIDLRRIALDARDTALPSFSVEEKRKDPRYGWFKERFGDRCWELDAMNPNTLRARLTAEIGSFIEWDEWRRCGLSEQAERVTFQTILNNWNAAAG
jgi:hypothetical protein